MFSKQAMLTTKSNKAQGTLFKVVPNLSVIPNAVVKQAIDKNMAANPNIYPDLTRFNLPKAIDTR